MKYLIHGTDYLGNDDEIEIEADTIEELQQIARKETEMRDWGNLWSEEVRV